MPTFPVGVTPVTSLDPLEMTFVSASGTDYSLSVRDNGATPAQARAMVDALADMSNLGLHRFSFQETVTFINKGLAVVHNEAYDENTKCIIVFSNANAGDPDVTIRLPAPDAGLFAPSGRLLDPAVATAAGDDRIATMQTAVLAYLEQVGFDYAYAGGYLNVIPASERGITPQIVDPAVDPQQAPTAPE